MFSLGCCLFPQGCCTSMYRIRNREYLNHSLQYSRAEQGTRCMNRTILSWFIPVFMDAEWWSQQRTGVDVESCFSYRQVSGHTFHTETKEVCHSAPKDACLAYQLQQNKCLLVSKFYTDILVFSGVVLRGRTFRMPLGHESGIILDKLVTERLAFSISVVHSVKDAVRRYLSACIKWPVIQYQTFGHLVLRFLSL